MLEMIEQTVREALHEISHERFYATERGYQGALYCTLHTKLHRRGGFDQGHILEIEYQKSRRHDMTQRPDIILHIPAQPPNMDVRANNLAVWALKRKANAEQADDDFYKLNEMMHRLNYASAYFINIDSQDTMVERYQGDFGDRLRVFAVWLENGRVRVRTGRPV